MARRVTSARRSDAGLGRQSLCGVAVRCRFGRGPSIDGCGRDTARHPEWRLARLAGWSIRGVCEQRRSKSVAVEVAKTMNNDQ